MSMSCSHLAFGYADQPVLSPLDLVFPAGQLTALLGANGCGKSTLLKLLAGQLTPDQGEIRLGDRRLSDWPLRERAQTLAYLPQYPELFADMPVFDLVRFGRFPYQGAHQQWQPEDEAAIERALTQTGLLPLARRSMQSLSGGQQQRAWIAMVLAQQADVLLLDEPINHLDLNHQVDIMDLLVELTAAGRTLLVVLHDLNLASRYADHLLLMQQGRILAAGDARQVLTVEHIAQAYQQSVHVMDDPVHGVPLVIPTSRHRRQAA